MCLKQWLLRFYYYKTMVNLSLDSPKNENSLIIYPSYYPMVSKEETKSYRFENTFILKRQHLIWGEQGQQTQDR